MNYRDTQIACAYQQAKTIHRLLLVLADDLGDLSAGQEFFGELSDEVSDTLEPAMQKLRDKLGSMSK